MAHAELLDELDRLFPKGDERLLANFRVGGADLVPVEPELARHEELASGLCRLLDDLELGLKTGVRGDVAEDDLGACQDASRVVHAVNDRASRQEGQKEGVNGFS